MDAAALPRGAAQRGRDHLLQPLMRIGRNEAHAAEAALDETAEKRRPKRPIFRRPHVDAQDLALALAGDATATTVAWLVTRPLTRTLWHLASPQRYGYSVVRGRVWNASTKGSSSAQIRETSDFDTPSNPRAFISSSTLRVDTPCT
jgi:hypothetical protein